MLSSLVTRVRQKTRYRRLVHEAILKIFLIANKAIHWVKALLSSPVLAPNVAISFGDHDAWLSDSFVDVLPGEPVYMKVKSDVPFEDLQKALKVMSVNQL